MGTVGTADLNPRVTRAMRLLSHVVLAVVAACGAVLSYASLYAAAEPVFGVLAYGFPVLVDALILGASLQYVAGARLGRAQAGWRLTAHAGIAGTIALNALAATDVAGIPWHVTAPAVWAVLVELYARQFAGEWKAIHRETTRIPARLWVTAPIESLRTWLRLARIAAFTGVRAEVGVHTAAVEALRLALPGRHGRRVRRVLRRQLRAGSLPPVAVLTACAWSASGTDAGRAPAEVLRTALALVLDPSPAATAPGPYEGTCSVPGGPTPSASAVGIDSPGLEPHRIEPTATGSTPTRTRSDRTADPDRSIHRRTRSASGSRSASGGRSGSGGGSRSMDRLRAALDQAIDDGTLPQHPTAEAIRRYLGIAPARARALRDEIAARSPLNGAASAANTRRVNPAIASHSSDAIGPVDPPRAPGSTDPAPSSIDGRPTPDRNGSRPASDPIEGRPAPDPTGALDPDPIEVLDLDRQPREVPA